MAALLTSVGADKDKSALYLGECRRMGIKVLPPDVNDSFANFSAVGTDVRFGLTAVRNVGANVVAEIVRTRETQGAFTSFADFLSKVPASVCNKRTIDSLVKAGAFDSLGHARRALNAIHEMAIDSVVGVKRQEATGQFDLFGDDPDLGGGVVVEVPVMPEWDKKTLLAFERDMLGPVRERPPAVGARTRHSFGGHASGDHGRRRARRWRWLAAHLRRLGDPG